MGRAYASGQPKGDRRARETELCVLMRGSLGAGTQVGQGKFPEIRVGKIPASDAWGGETSGPDGDYASGRAPIQDSRAQDPFMETAAESEGGEPGGNLPRHQEEPTNIPTASAGRKRPEARRCPTRTAATCPLPDWPPALSAAEAFLLAHGDNPFRNEETISLLDMTGLAQKAL